MRILVICTLLVAASALAQTPSPEFTPADAGALLDRIQQGLEGNNPDQVLSAFSPDMPGYQAFQEQLRGLFAKYESFRSFYRILDLRSESGRGIVLAQFDMEATPAGGNAPPVHTTAQVRFEMAPAHGGWRIVNLDPRSFFS